MKKFLSLVVLTVLMVGFLSLMVYSENKKEQISIVFPAWLDKGLESKWSSWTGLGEVSEDEALAAIRQKIDFLHKCSQHKKLEPLLRLTEIKIVRISNAKGVAIIELSHNGVHVNAFEDVVTASKGDWEKSLYLSVVESSDLKRCLKDPVFRHALYGLLKLTDEDIFEIIGTKFHIEKPDTLN